jgi:signal transduction histidine kinase
MADLLAAAVAARAERAAQLGVRVHPQSDAEGAMRGDADLLARALGELLDRALDRPAPAGGERRLDAECGENLAGTEVWVRVRSDGAAAGGAPELEADDPDRLGLGLARRIAEAHGGRLEAHAAGPRCELLLTLPKPGAGAAEEARAR